LPRFFSFLFQSLFFLRKLFDHTIKKNIYY
jgi:hypothetical protein